MSNQQLRHPQRAVPKLRPVREMNLIPILSITAGALAAIFVSGNFIEHSVRIGGAREVERAASNHDRIGPSGVSAVKSGPERRMLAIISRGEIWVPGAVFPP